MSKVVLNLSTLSTKQFNKAINLLPLEYRDQNIPVYIFQNLFIYKLFTLLFFNSKCVADVSKHSKGFFMYKKQNDNILPICIVLFNYGFILEVIVSLYHEFRHVYQHKLGYTKKHRHYHRHLEHCTSTDELDTYDLQFIERDANIFASYFIKKHKSTIKQIFNLEFSKFNVNSHTGYYSVNCYSETTLYCKFLTVLKTIRKYFYL